MDPQQQPAPVKKVLVKRVKVLVKRPVAAPTPAAPIPAQRTVVTAPAVKRPAPQAARKPFSAPENQAARKSFSAPAKMPAQTTAAAPVKPQPPRDSITYDLPDNIMETLEELDTAQKLFFLYIYARTFAAQTARKTGQKIPPMLIELPTKASQIDGFLRSVDSKFFDAVFDDFIELAPFIKGMKNIVSADAPWEQIARSETRRLKGSPLTMADQIILAYLDIMLDIDILREKMKQAVIRKRAKQLINDITASKERVDALKQRFVSAIERKKFPVDAKKLIDNYFTLAKKDPEQAYQTLITNPLYFSPIQLELMPKKLFGLSKPSAQDAMAVNKQLASFLKRLKA